MKDLLEFLKATAHQPVHSCRLVSKVENTETKLKTVLSDPTHVRGITLDTELNQRRVTLLLDTGAGGILVNRRIAEKAGLTRISGIHYRGIGDKGAATGYKAVADHIRIGDLEFEDCVVSVSDRRSVAEEDGLIGADVFGAYLVDIDLPGKRLNLSPLPKRPEDRVAPRSLNSEGEEQVNAEQKEKAATPPEQRPISLRKNPHLSREIAMSRRKWRIGRRCSASDMPSWFPLL